MIEGNRLAVILMTYILGLSSISFAGEIAIDYAKPLEVTISSRAVNRISFGKGQIIKVAGDSSKYHMLLSDDGHNLFMTSRVAPPEAINLSLMTAKGQVIDLKANLDDREDPALIDIALDRKDLVFCKKIESQDQIRDLMLHMARGERGKYYVEKASRALQVKDNRSLTLKQESLYRYGDLMGASFVVKEARHRDRKGFRSYITKSDIFALFDELLAVAITPMSDGKEQRVFIAFKREEGGK